jgi:hypothetical protein
VAFYFYKGIVVNITKNENNSSKQTKTKTDTTLHGPTLVLWGHQLQAELDKSEDEIITSVGV